MAVVLGDLEVGRWGPAACRRHASRCPHPSRQSCRGMSWKPAPESTTSSTTAAMCTAPGPAVPRRGCLLFSFTGPVGFSLCLSRRWLARLHLRLPSLCFTYTVCDTERVTREWTHTVADALAARCDLCASQFPRAVCGTCCVCHVLPPHMHQLPTSFIRPLPSRFQCGTS